MGTYLRNRADNSVVTGIGDGTLDPGYDSCSNAKLPRAEVKQVMSGFGLMIENIAALGSSISAGMSGNISGVGTICAGLGLSCTSTDPTAVSDADADMFRNAIKSDKTSDLGIENCTPLLPTCC